MSQFYLRVYLKDSHLSSRTVLVSLPRQRQTQNRRGNHEYAEGLLDRNKSYGHANRVSSPFSVTFAAGIKRTRYLCCLLAFGLCDKLQAA